MGKGIYYNGKDTKIIGRLALQNIKDIIPVIDGTNLEDLRQGAGYYQKSVPFGETGTCVILGHRESVFHNLGELRQNHRITVQTTKKNYTYRVKEIRIADKIDESLLKQKELAQLLLVTCYPIKLTGPVEKRYIVIATLEGIS